MTPKDDNTNTAALQEELVALNKENRALVRKLKETEYLVSSYEQYTVFQKSIYESLRKQIDEQDTYLRLIFSTTPNIILVLDANMTYILGTKKTLNEIGIDADALAGQNFAGIFSSIMPETWIRSLQQELHKVLSGSAPKTHGKHMAMMNGEERCYKTSIVPFNGTTGKIMGAIFFMHDETELHGMAIAAESSNKAKTNFLARISHEIRTPMNAIAGMSELILREQTTGLIREHALSIKQASGNLMAIINDVLDFSKIESGKLEIIGMEYRLLSLLNDVISIIRTRVLDKQIFFVANVDCNTPNRLIGDEVRIRQILLNLLSNAFKYCDKGYISIRVSYEKLGNDSVTMIFDISDSGCGIKPEDQDKLFEDFVQFDMRVDKVTEGTGLGLVITKNLCEAMGGSVSVHSAYGEGSTFTARLPQKIGAYEKFAFVNDAVGISVLIYETRQVYLDSITDTLSNLGVSYTLISNQSMFLEELNKRTYSHAFISSFLFESIDKIIKNLGISITIARLSEYGENTINRKNVRTLEMPAHSVTIANLLNGIEDADSSETPQGHVRFIAPTAQILIVDDLITNLRVAEGLMLPYRMQIDICRSGREALEMVKHTAYDIVFMDHMMPDMDGIETTLKIRELNESNCKDVPIVALTANAMSGVKEMFLQNGFNDFLAKPVEMIKLNAILETWLPKNKLQAYAGMAKPEQAAPSFEIQGIDITTGIYMTGGSEANYLRVLSAFYRDGMETIAKLREHCQKGDLRNYAACAHAVKGAAASVGAAKLSSLAKAMELAAKNEDANYIKNNSAVFIDEFDALLRNVGYVISATDKKRGGNAAEPIAKEQVIKLKNALANLDIETADTILAELQGKSWDGQTDNALEEIANKILICEYDDALKIIDGVIGDL
ncbi:MAG: response regulator [Chitinispirillales bacterium]|jgi:signal transduction histidine kinase/CheY-like chemotaxis protein/HPt (histidine-containing phosphotransfer) domain-containing protein|nr:response regulator [Chitinispirillales bacterium]